MAKSTKEQFVRVFIFIVIFVVFTAMIYQRTFNANSTEITEQINSELNGNLRVNNSSTVITAPVKIVNAPTYREMKPKSFSEADLFQQVNQLNDKIKYSLDWVANMKTGSAGGYPLIRWDLLSNAEIHILNKLAVHLKKALSEKNASSKLFTLINKGYQCDAVQATQQEVISKRISMDICSEA
jgi:hypothetical protein